MLLGMSKPIHVVVPSVTARGIVNLSALAVVEAQEQREAAARSDGVAVAIGLIRRLVMLLAAARRPRPLLLLADCGRSSVPRSRRSSRCSPWIAALGGLALALLLILTGRGRRHWARWSCSARCCGSRGSRPQARRRGGGRPAPPPRHGRPMTRQEAYEVLGLKPARDAEHPRRASPADARGPSRRRRLGLAGVARSIRRATCCLG